MDNLLWAFLQLAFSTVAVAVLPINARNGSLTVNKGSTMVANASSFPDNASLNARKPGPRVSFSFKNNYTYSIGIAISSGEPVTHSKSRFDLYESFNDHLKAGAKSETSIIFGENISAAFIWARVSPASECYKSCLARDHLPEGIPILQVATYKKEITFSPFYLVSRNSSMKVDPPHRAIDSKCKPLVLPATDPFDWPSSRCKMAWRHDFRIRVTFGP